MRPPFHVDVHTAQVWHLLTGLERLSRARNRAPTGSLDRTTVKRDLMLIVNGLGRKA